METPQLPEWYLRGHIVNVTERSPDAQYILDGDEFDWDWRECMVPTTDYISSSAPFGADPDHGLAGVSDTQEGERIERIRNWMAQYGHPGAALKQSPVLAVIHRGKLRILDGWHRVQQAHLRYRLDTIPSVVAVAPDNWE